MSYKSLPNLASAYWSSLNLSTFLIQHGDNENNQWPQNDSTLTHHIHMHTYAHTCTHTGTNLFQSLGKTFLCKFPHILSCHLSSLFFQRSDWIKFNNIFPRQIIRGKWVDAQSKIEGGACIVGRKYSNIDLTLKIPDIHSFSSGEE